ncbi:MAG: dihydropteroate synthase [Gemmatimonadetes bacterium]|nr:dihydropteroate synthase [Gemmatimonadota bacterium]
MNVTPLTLRSPAALLDELRARGWDAGTATTTAGGVTPLAVRCTGLGDDTLQALVVFGGSHGLDVITGPGWAVISGSRARLGALARPWFVPEPLQELATRIGLALPADIPVRWQTARGPVALDRPLIVGILNVTPDSFSDGGQLRDAAAVLARAAELVRDGAGMLDVGGESTRPGRTAEVPLEEELRRTIPVVELLARELEDTPLSIDTVKAGVARAALAAGAAVVNDVAGLRLDGAMGDVVARAGAGLVLMHSRGTNLELASYAHVEYGDDLVGTVIAELRAGMRRATEAGIAPAAVAVDPGLGFGKTPGQSLALLDALDAFQCLDRPLYVGPSRKRFLGDATGLPAEARDTASAAACALAWERGARVFRVHNVRRAREALAVAHALDTRLSE